MGVWQEGVPLHGSAGEATTEAARKDARNPRQKDINMGVWQEGVPLHGSALWWRTCQGFTLRLPSCQGFDSPGEKEVLYGKLGRGSPGAAPGTARVSLPEPKYPGATLRPLGGLGLHHCGAEQDLPLVLRAQHHLRCHC